MTTVREPFSPKFSFSQRVRSTKSVSFAMLKAELRRHLRPCGGKIVLFLMLLCDRLPGILLLPATRNQVASSGSRMSRASNNSCHAGRTKICPRLMSCQSCQLNGHSCSNPVRSNHQYQTESTCKCQVVTTVRGPFSTQFPFLQRLRSMKSVSIAMLKAELGRHLRPCGGKIVLFLMLLCDRLPGILLLPATRNQVASSGSRMSRASNNSCHAGRTKICPRLMSCQSCQLNGHSCSNPVRSNHQYQTESTCKCQVVTTVRGPFSTQFPFLQRLRSMKSVSIAMLKAELGRHLRPCGGKIVLFLMLLCDRLPGILLLPATRNQVASSCSRMSRASNNSCHAGRTNIWPRSMSCQSCPLNEHSCGNPVHSNHQYRTESTHACVKQ